MVDGSLMKCSPLQLPGLLSPPWTCRVVLRKIANDQVRLVPPLQEGCPKPLGLALFCQSRIILSLWSALGPMGTASSSSWWRTFHAITWSVQDVSPLKPRPPTILPSWEYRGRPPPQRELLWIRTGDWCVQMPVLSPGRSIALRCSPPSRAMRTSSTGLKGGISFWPHCLGGLVIPVLLGDPELGPDISDMRVWVPIPSMVAFVGSGCISSAGSMGGSGSWGVRIDVV